MIGESLLLRCVERDRIAVRVEFACDEPVRPLRRLRCRVEVDPELAKDALRPVAEPFEQAMPGLVPLCDGVLDPPGAARGGCRFEARGELAAEAAPHFLGMHVSVDPPQLAAVVEGPEGNHAFAVQDNERVACEVERLPFRLEITKGVPGGAVQRPLVGDHELGDGGCVAVDRRPPS